ncbi:unnamed protein product, partial [Cyprideis torosa]
MVVRPGAMKPLQADSAAVVESPSPPPISMLEEMQSSSSFQDAESKLNGASEAEEFYEHRLNMSCGNDNGVERISRPVPVKKRRAPVFRKSADKVVTGFLRSKAVSLFRLKTVFGGTSHSQGESQSMSPTESPLPPPLSTLETVEVNSPKSAISCPSPSRELPRRARAPSTRLIESIESDSSATSRRSSASSSPARLKPSTSPPRQKDKKPRSTINFASGPRSSTRPSSEPPNGPPSEAQSGLSSLSDTQSEPQSGSPSATGPQSGSPSMSGSQSEPQSGSPSAAGPQSGSPSMSGSQSEPQSGFPSAAGPQSGSPSMSGSQSEPQSGFPSAADPQSGSPSMSGPQSVFISVSGPPSSNKPLTDSSSAVDWSLMPPPPPLNLAAKIKRETSAVAAGRPPPGLLAASSAARRQEKHRSGTQGRSILLSEGKFSDVVSEYTPGLTPPRGGRLRGNEGRKRNLSSRQEEGGLVKLELMRRTPKVKLNVRKPLIQPSKTLNQKNKKGTKQKVPKGLQQKAKSKREKGKVVKQEEVQESSVPSETSKVLEESKEVKKQVVGNVPSSPTTLSRVDVTKLNETGVDKKPKLNETELDETQPRLDKEQPTSDETQPKLDEAKLNGTGLSDIQSKLDETQPSGSDKTAGNVPETVTLKEADSHEIPARVRSSSRPRRKPRNRFLDEDLSSPVRKSKPSKKQGPVVEVVPEKKDDVGDMGEEDELPELIVEVDKTSQEPYDVAKEEVEERVSSEEKEEDEVTPAPSDDTTQNFPPPTPSGVTARTSAPATSAVTAKNREFVARLADKVYALEDDVEEDMIAVAPLWTPFRQRKRAAGMDPSSVVLPPTPSPPAESEGSTPLGSAPPSEGEGEENFFEEEGVEDVDEMLGDNQKVEEAERLQEEESQQKVGDSQKNIENSEEKVQGSPQQVEDSQPNVEVEGRQESVEQDSREKDVENEDVEDAVDLFEMGDLSDEDVPSEPEATGESDSQQQDSFYSSFEAFISDPIVQEVKEDSPPKLTTTDQGRTKAKDT